MRYVLLVCAAASALVAPLPRVALPRRRRAVVFAAGAGAAEAAEVVPAPRAPGFRGKVARLRDRCGWRGALAAGGVCGGAAWALRAPLAAALERSFLGAAGASLCRAGARRDGLMMLSSFALAIPALKGMGVSPVLGFMATGVALGPHGLAVVSDLRMTEALAELGVCFFLFEMGLELSMERLRALKKEILGLGVAQYAATTALLAAAARAVLGPAAPAGAALVVGASLALSSSAFALQLLRDTNDLATAHGRAALGVLLLQDLAVVPLLASIPMLAGGQSAVLSAVGAALLKGIVALGFVELVGKRVIDTLFYFAAKSKSQEAFLAVVLLTVLSMSSLAEAFALSAPLGAFLAGVGLSETRYRYQVEADVAPFRGVLLGLFFATVGFSIDPRAIAANPARISGAVLGLVGGKAAVLGGLGALFRLPASSAVRTGLLLAPGGEFAFVAFAPALESITGKTAGPGYIFEPLYLAQIELVFHDS